MKDIPKKTVNLLLVIFIITIIVQIFFTLNNPFVLTGKASSTANISVTIMPPPSLPSLPSAPLPTIGRQVGGTICYPAWECREWSECVDGIQTKTCIDKTGCLQPYKETRTCIIPTCDDGIQNQDETDIDCGGQFCKPCGDGQKCRLDTDCINECDATIGICYISIPVTPLAPPITITPAPTSMWERSLISKWEFIIPIIIISVLIIIAFNSPIAEPLKKALKK